MKMFLKIQFLPRRAQDFEPSESEKRGKTGILLFKLMLLTII